MKFKIVLLVFYEELYWNFEEDYIESVECFGRKASLKILILRIHKHDLMSFFNVLKFLLHKSFICLVEVIPRYY